MRLPKKVRTERYSFRLDKDTLTALTILADDDERTPSDWLSVMIRRQARERGIMDAQGEILREMIPQE